MAYFQTELLELTRPVNSKGVKFMGVNTGDPEDPHDHICKAINYECVPILYSILLYIIFLQI